VTYVEVSLQVSPVAVEAACHLLHELGSGGVVLDDEGAGRLRAYLPRDERLGGRLAELRRRLDGLGEHFPGPVGWRIELAEVAEADWATAWRAHWRPRRVGRRLVVVPAWHDYRPAPGDVVLRLDPGMAFGTGEHASTRLALAALERELAAAPPGELTVGDLGTGSGILAVAAARLGAAAVWAVDVDPLAVRVAAENAARNGVAARVRVAAGGPEAIPEPVHLLVANLTADLHVELAGAEASRLRPGGRLLASGVVAGEAERVRAALAAAGLRPTAERAAEGWVLIAADRAGA
jgi:ribosomal protein L11 methyltransferase